MMGTETTPAPAELYDWSVDPECAGLLLDPYRSAAEALAGAARHVVDLLAPIEGGPPEDDCPTCVLVRECRAAVTGFDLLVGSEER